MSTEPVSIAISVMAIAGIKILVFSRLSSLWNNRLLSHLNRSLDLAVGIG